MMRSLDIQEWLSANPPRTCDAASITKPIRLGVGWTKSGEVTAQYSHGDFSGLSALQTPSTPLNLNQGLENFVPKRADDTAGVEILIQESFAAGASLENCDILSFRNNFNKILGTVFDIESAWTVDATSGGSGGGGGKLPPTLFLDMVKTEELHYGNDSTPFVAWGYNFEALCTGEAYADANSEYGMLVNFRLEHGGNKNGNRATDVKSKPNFSIYLGAEIDAYDPVEAQSESRDVESIPPMSSLREIKTFTRPEHPRQWWTTYNLRHPKWWLQSYLAGVQALLLGARDNNGIVHEIHAIKTADLPRISWKNGCTWSPQQALAFGADVLAWMAEICKSGNCVEKHVRFVYDPNTRKIYASIIEDGDLPGRITAAILQQQELKVKN
jgi:RAT1-interacting protein